MATTKSLAQVLEKEPAALEEHPDGLGIREGSLTTGDELKNQKGILGRLLYYEDWLDRKLGVEPHGPRRITPENKKPPNPWVMFLMWGSGGCYTLGAITTGFIPAELGLSLTQSILLVVFGVLIGCACAGWCATLGPGTGLRQVAISRYSFGWWPSKIIALLNIIEQMGWSAIGCITGGQAISAVSGYTVSVVVGIAIINIVGILFSFGGYTAIVKIENYFWIPFLIIFLIIYGEVGPQADQTTPAQVSGMTLSGNVLSTFAVFYGDGISWSSIISDYYVNYPTKTSKMKVWLFTTFGLAIPIILGLLVGCLVASTMQVNEDWANSFDTNGIGGLVLTMLYPQKFAKFLLVLLAFGGVGLNIIAIYSAALSIQQFAKPLQAVPRFVWSLFSFACILALSIGGRTQILDFLSNFLSLLGYYNTAFVAILAIEHFYFRKGNLANYDLENWNDPAKLPVGIAGLLAFLLGIVGAILGMVETFYVGVIAKQIGADGGDIGNELALALTVISYVPLRTWELRYFGR